MNWNDCKKHWSFCIYKVRNEWAWLVLIPVFNSEAHVVPTLFESIMRRKMSSPLSWDEMHERENKSFHVFTKMCCVISFDVKNGLYFTPSDGVTYLHNVKLRHRLVDVMIIFSPQLWFLSSVLCLLFPFKNISDLWWDHGNEVYLK